MDAHELFLAGRLAEAMEAQIQEVKAAPGEQSKRLFLFELAAFSGDLDRAQRQIEAVKYDDPQVEASVGIYRKLLLAERLRRQLFAEGVRPKFLVEPPEHVSWRLEAVDELRGGNQAKAVELLHKANVAAPAIVGELNGKKFDFLMDEDHLFGTVLEVMSNGMYFWVPIEQIQTLSIKPPQAPRDLLWIRTQIEMQHGGGGIMFLPALYPGSHEHAKDEVKLGRITEWLQAEGSPQRAIGQKSFLVGDDEVPLLEWRDLKVK